MNKINLLMVIALWVVGHMVIYSIHKYLVGMYEYNVPFIILLTIAAIMSHYRFSTDMKSKVSTYL